MISFVYFYLILQFSERSSSKRARIKHTEYENCEEDMTSSGSP
jgi:hypothetical protein